MGGLLHGKYRTTGRPYQLGAPSILHVDLLHELSSLPGLAEERRQAEKTKAEAADLVNQNLVNCMTEVLERHRIEAETREQQAEKKRRDSERQAHEKRQKQMAEEMRKVRK